MKKSVLLVALFFLFISCVTKDYVWNNQNKPRPTAKFKFHLDKTSFVPNANFMIDTNSIYVTTSYKRKLDDITCIFYRFYPNGIVYEFVLKGEPIELAIIDTATANYGKYRILKSNKIRMEFMIKYVERNSNIIQVTRNFYDAKVVGENLEFTPLLYSKEKGFYSFLSGGGGAGGGYGELLLGTIYLIDTTLPDEKAIFHRVPIQNAGAYLAQKNF